MSNRHKPKVGDRVRFVTAVAPEPCPLGAVGTVTGTDQKGEAYGPFEGRRDMILVEVDGPIDNDEGLASEYQFAPEELKVIRLPPRHP